MGKKKIEISLGVLIIIFLIAIIILGAFVYYFYTNPNSSNSISNENTLTQNTIVADTEQNTDANTLNTYQNTDITANSTNNYNQNTYTDSQTDISASANSNTNTNEIINNSESTSTPSITNDLTAYKGVWKSDQILDSGIPEEELIINNITENSISFDYIKYRISSFENVVAHLTNNLATFEISNDSVRITGTITLSNNTVILTINSSSFEYVKPGSYTFKTKTQNSVLK